MVRLVSVLKSLIHTHSLLIVLSLLGLALAGPAHAFNYVVDANGTYWGIQDAALPVVDTGSIRATQVAPAGQSGAYSTSINGFGGIKVLVQTGHEGFPIPIFPVLGFPEVNLPELAFPDMRYNGEMMRGYGLKFDGVSRFSTTQSIRLGGIEISRSVYINAGADWGRWLDTFTNTTFQSQTIKVAFGGQSGMGTSGSRFSTICANTFERRHSRHGGGFVGGCRYASHQLDVGRRPPGDGHRNTQHTHEAIRWRHDLRGQLDGRHL